MKKIISLKAFIVLSLFAVIFACGSDNGDVEEEEYTELSPVVMDLSTVPYEKLSDYKFFEGEMKNLQPAYRVIPYDLNSELFTDYALKKRFVWMPHGVKAVYSADGEVVNFPVGAALIKNFYYDTVDAEATTQILETRLMIKKADGWIFATYVWNEEQTEAFLDADGSVIRVVVNLNGEPTQINYKVPSETNCAECHSLNDVFTPIGPKPQNLNKNFTYANGIANQLAKWKQEGYLGEVPATIASTIDWTNESQPLDLRVRSYMDINCAHCHVPGNWEHQTLNLAFNQTSNAVNMGICVVPQDFVSGPQTYIVTSQDAELSFLHFRMNSDVQSDMMPPVGRTVIHAEAVEMIEEWINTMDTPCP